VLLLKFYWIEGEWKEQYDFSFEEIRSEKGQNTNNVGFNNSNRECSELLGSAQK